MISVSNKPAVLVRGDFHPAELYIGANKITGWNTSSQSGQSLSFQNTYNSPFDELVISGATNQDSTTGAQLLQGTETMQNIGGEVATAAGTFTPEKLMGCDVLKTDKAWAGYKINFANIAERCGIQVGDTVTYSIWCRFDGLITKNSSFSFYYLDIADGKAKSVILKSFNPSDAESLMEWQKLSYTFVVTETLISCTNLRIESNYFENSDYTTTIANALFAAPMLRLGNEAAGLPWEPYTGGQPSPSPDYPQPFIDATGTITDGHSVVTIPATMQGVSYRVTPGKVEKIEDWEEVILDGTEAVIIQSVNNYGITNIQLPFKPQNPDIVCNRLSTNGQSSISVTTCEGFLFSNVYATYVRLYASRVGETAESVKSYFAGQHANSNPYILRYRIETPITTDITATPLGQSLLQLACHRGGTQITQSSGDLPFALSATAKTYGQGV